jgi:L-alanine-DL-glutamate epimerase-like enolase superfamily enzyme
MNSYDRAPKGHTYANTLVRVRTDAGVEGVGVMGYTRPEEAFLAALKTLIGADPLALYEMRDGRITGRAPVYSAVLRRYRHLDGPLFDLIGQLTAKPVWKLLGGAVRERIEVYDGTLYFSDVWFKDRGVSAVVEEAVEAQRSGYRGIKLKMGRGSRWMPKQAGLERDIAVIQAVRQAVGPGMKILADANNGFREDLEGAWRLISGTAGEQVYWWEEVVPESITHYSELRARMRKAGISSLMADGENMTALAQFEPYLFPARLVDVLQMDIRTGGFLDNREMARKAEAAGAVAVPHNWGSQVGLLMGLQLAKAVKTVPAAEDDRSTCDALLVDGYRCSDGLYTVPDTPGLSVRVNEAVYRDKYRAAETVVS